MSRVQWRVRGDHLARRSNRDGIWGGWRVVVVGDEFGHKGWGVGVRISQETMEETSEEAGGWGVSRNDYFSVHFIALY